MTAAPSLREAAQLALDELVVLKKIVHGSKKTIGAAKFDATIEALRAALCVMPVERQPLDLTALDALARVYCTNYYSPHHMAFSVSGLRSLIEAHGIKGAA